MLMLIGERSAHVYRFHMNFEIHNYMYNVHVYMLQIWCKSLYIKLIKQLKPSSREIHPAFRLGPVYWGQFGEVLSFLWPTVHTTFSNAPTFRGQSRLSDFGCALDHSTTKFCAWANLMKTAVRYQLRAQGRSPLPGTNMFGGTTGRSPCERPHYGIAGESPGKWDPMWTPGQGMTWLKLPLQDTASWKLNYHPPDCPYLRTAPLGP